MSLELTASGAIAPGDVGRGPGAEPVIWRRMAGLRGQQWGEAKDQGEQGGAARKRRDLHRTIFGSERVTHNLLLSAASLALLKEAFQRTGAEKLQSPEDLRNLTPASLAYERCRHCCLSS